MIQWYFSKECFWLRIFGYGFCANDRSSYTPFSVRSGCVKELRIGKWGFKLLRSKK